MGIMNDNKEKLLTALSKVPIALTSQLGLLLPSYAHPEKEASRLLNQLLQDGLVEANYHGQQRIWRLSKAGRKAKNKTWKKISNISHSLAVGDIYFKLQPKMFLFEPLHKFKYLGKERFWEPDCIVYGEKEGKGYLWCIEMQLTPIPSKRWSIKWENYNLFFKHNYQQAQYQEWFTKPVRPTRFIAITSQQPETVKTGFDIEGRTLDIRASL